MADPLLAQLPAEADVAAFVTAGEVDQAHPIVLQLAPDLGQLVHEVLKVLQVQFEPRLDLLLRLARGQVLQVGLRLERLGVRADDIAGGPQVGEIAGILRNAMAAGQQAEARCQQQREASVPNPLLHRPLSPTRVRGVG